MWEHWDGFLHSSTQTQKEILDSQINEQLTALYNYGGQDVPQDVFTFFQIPLVDLLQQHQNNKKKWIASVQAAKARKQHHNCSVYLSEQQFMRCWFRLEDQNSGS